MPQYYQPIAKKDKTKEATNSLILYLAHKFFNSANTLKSQRKIFLHVLSVSFLEKNGNTC